MSGEGEIRPFRVEIPQADLDDLRDRLGRARWPAESPGAAWEDGVPLAYLQDLAEYWRTTYDWRRHEARLNEFPQFTTEIDGQHVHFLHVRSAEPAAVPLIITHGWPGSVVEFLDMIGPLTDPAAHGGDPADAFHVVAPSIPGFGFSGPVSEPGWNVRRIALAWAELMRRLGYDRYGAQGGDWGAAISRRLGQLDPDHVIGVHLNTLNTYGPGDAADVPKLSDVERARIETYERFSQDGLGYSFLQSTRPQTLAYGLTDSPVGQLAWIAEKFKEWTDSADSPEDAVDRDHLLTNVTLYWLTGTAGSAARLYREARRAWAEVEPSDIPTGVAVFPREIAPAIRRFAERTDNIVHWSEFDQGGHFPAMEEPDLLVGDVRDFFRKLR